MPGSATQQTVPERRLALGMVGAGAVGLVAAFVLTIEKIRLIEDPTYVPSCSLNPVLSCGSVMSTAQAELFGFPNSLLGIIGFTVILTAGAALLAGVRTSVWFWTGLQVGALVGLVFVHWLIFQSIYRIEALCPYCMVVWAVTVPLVWYLTLRNLQAASARLPAWLRQATAFAAQWHSSLLVLWFVVLIALIGRQFWFYWSTLL